MKKFVQVVLLGDSASWSWRSAYGLRYADFLEQDLQRMFGDAACVDVAACGDGSDTVREGLRRLERDCLAYRPDAVVVNFGANDAFLMPDRETFRRSLGLLIVEIRRKTGAALVLETLPGIDDRRYVSEQYARLASGYGGFNAYLEHYSHTTIRDVARAERITLHDRYAILHDRVLDNPRAWEKLILGDGIHPTIEGDALFARSLADILFPLLGASLPGVREDASAWLDAAKSGDSYRECLAARTSAELREILGRPSGDVRLFLQRSRSLARRAFTVSTDQSVASEAAAIMHLASALLGAERAVKPFDDTSRDGSIAWAIPHLDAVAGNAAAEIIAGLLNGIRSPD